MPNIHASSQDKLSWKSIDCKTCSERIVSELQMRIEKAVREVTHTGRLTPPPVASDPLVLRKAVGGKTGCRNVSMTLRQLPS